MGRAKFIILNALAALAVGSIGLGVFGSFMGWTWPSTSIEYEALWRWFLMVALPAPVSAAISAYVCSLDSRFHQRTQWIQTIRVCFLAYILYVPMFAAGVSLNSSFLDGWGEVIFMYGSPLVLTISIVPVLVIEYMLIGKTQSRRYSG